MNILGYIIEDQIGQGGMATVYRATQESLGRPVALKVMNPLLANSPEFSKRFLGEGRLLASLRHNNIITIHDIGVCDNFHYISMEYVAGGDLKQRIRDGISPETALDYVISIGNGLMVAHAEHIVHRDVKPVNILFRPDGTLLLTDFGIAKQLEGGLGLTATGSMVGSPYYLSPEQARGNPIDGRADIYSLGIVLYEMLVGEKPFNGDSQIDVALKHIEGKLPDLPQALARFQPLLNRMTEKQPQDRYDDAESMLQALQQLRDTELWDETAAEIPSHEAILGFDDTTVLEVVVDRSNASGQAVVVGSKSTRLEETAIDVDKPDAIPASAGELLHPVVLSGSNRVLPGSRNFVTGRVGGLAVVVCLLGLYVALITVGLPGFKNNNIPVEPISSKQTEQAHQADRAQPVKPPEQATSVEQAEQPNLPQQPRSPEPTERTKLPEQIKRAKLPKPTEQAKPPGQTEVEELLRSAQTALSAYRLTVPHHDSAFFYYQKVLQLDPGNIQAANGPSLIADRYHRLARKEINKGRDEKAKHYVDSGLRVKDNHPELLALRDKLTKQEVGDNGSTKTFYQRVKDAIRKPDHDTKSEDEIEDNLDTGSDG